MTWTSVSFLRCLCFGFTPQSVEVFVSSEADTNTQLHIYPRFVWKSLLTLSEQDGPMRTFICTAGSACVTGPAPSAGLWVISQWFSGGSWRVCRCFMCLRVGPGSGLVQKEVPEVLRGFCRSIVHKEWSKGFNFQALDVMRRFQRHLEPRCHGKFLLE